MEPIVGTTALTDRRRVLNSALVPEIVPFAGNAELGTRADRALEHFAVIADLPDDAHHPISGQPQLFAEVALNSHQPLDLGLLRFQRIIYGLRRDTELLGIDHGEMRPLDDIEPLIVAMAHGRPERLLGDDLRQDHVVVWSAELQPLGKEL